MKIEKINDNQLRFTLTREDLVSRNIKLSELAYGSDQAKKLFREMLQQAASDYGFEINNKPLMVEAIPVSGDSIILIVTKVNNPEELDSRFSHFSAEKGAGSLTGKSSSSGADDVLDLIAKLDKIRKSAAARKKENSPEENAAGSSNASAGRRDTENTAVAGGSGDEEDVVSHLSRFFLFHDLDTVISAAQVLGAGYQGPNSLYKNPEDGNYYLIIRKGDTTPEIFNRVCNILSEYSMQGVYEDGLDAFFAEHMTVILRDKAIQSLRLLKD